MERGDCDFSFGLNETINDVTASVEDCFVVELLVAQQAKIFIFFLIRILVAVVRKSCLVPFRISSAGNCLI
jgi:hypothetical protein